MRKSLAIVLLLVFLGGCAAPPPVEGPKPPKENGGIKTVRADAFEAFNGFAFNLYAELENGKNILVSPVSVAVALSMAMNGAAGETRKAMAEGLLAQGIEPEKWNSDNKLLLAELAASDVTLEIANSLWLRKGRSFLPGFIATNEEFYRAEVNELDFNAPQAVPTINNWVDDRTHGLIKEIIASPISAETVAFLLNAVYFYGDWSLPFPAFATANNLFNSPGGERLALFMRQTAEFDYLETEDLQAIRLPYGEGNLAMYVFLPQDLTSFFDSLNEEQWAGWRQSFTMQRGQLALPKFEFGYEQSLNQALTALGMGRAFQAGQADFSEMSATERLFLQEVKHKTFITVDEKGTEAAAVTSIAVGTTSMPPPPTFNMQVDRPFFFMIHDQKTDTILFMGTVYDPSE